MKIADIFYSIQGEGKLVGVPSVFIRTSGCNLRCTWCDTPYTSWSPEGESLDVEAIVDQVVRHQTHYVVITGGEPMIAPGIEALTVALKARDYHITIETAATVWKDVVCDLASISPKLANSTPWERDVQWARKHEATRINLDVIRRFMQCPDYQFKFVIDTPDDLSEVESLLHQIGSHEVAGDSPMTNAPSVASARSFPCEGAKTLPVFPIPASHVLLMPQCVTREALNAKSQWLADLCKQKGYRYCSRLHIELFGNTRAT